MKKMKDYYFVFSYKGGGIGCRNIQLPFNPPFTTNEIIEISKSIEHLVGVENVFIINYFPIRTKRF